jgi:hypothetical protein
MSMSGPDHEQLNACCDAVHALSGQLLDEGHDQRDVANALLHELLAFNCDSPDGVDRYLSGLLARFRRNRGSIDAAFSQQAMH